MDEQKPDVTGSDGKRKEVGGSVGSGQKDQAVAVTGMGQVSDETSKDYLSCIYTLNQLHQYIVKHFPGRNKALLEDAWVGKIIIRSELAALAEILAEKGILIPEDYVRRTIRELTANITYVEKEHGLVRKGN